MPLWLDYLCAATGLISFALSLKASIIISNPRTKVNCFLHIFSFLFTCFAISLQVQPQNAIYCILCIQLTQYDVSSCPAREKSRSSQKLLLPDSIWISTIIL